MIRFRKIFFVVIAFLGAILVVSCSNKEIDLTNITYDKLVAANNREEVIKKYGNLYVEEIGISETNKNSICKTLFFSNQYGLAMDSEFNSDEYNDTRTIINGVNYYSAREINTGKVDEYAFIIAEDYNQNIGKRNNIENSLPMISKKVEKGNPYVEDGMIALKIAYYMQTCVLEETYYCNLETLLIERLKSKYTLDTGVVEELVTTYVYSSDYVAPMKEYKRQQNASDKISFVVVNNADFLNETRNLYTVKSSAKVLVSGNYALFDDKTYSNEVLDVNSYTKDGYVPMFYLAKTSDVTAKQLIDANDTYTNVNKYNNVQMITKTTFKYDETDEEVYTSHVFLTSNEFGLVCDFDYYRPDKSLDKSVTYLNGAKYLYVSPNEEEKVNESYEFHIMGKECYNDYFQNYGLNSLFDENFNGPFVIVNGKIVLNVSDEYGSSEYVFDSETLLLEKYVTCYTYNDGLFVKMEFSFTYGVDYTPERIGYNYHQNATDKISLEVVYNENGNMIRTSHNVSLSSNILALNDLSSIITLYSDEECTMEIKDIKEFLSTTKSFVVYVVENKQE